LYGCTSIHQKQSNAFNFAITFAFSVCIADACGAAGVSQNGQHPAEFARSFLLSIDSRFSSSLPALMVA